MPMLLVLFAVAMEYAVLVVAMANCQPDVSARAVTEQEIAHTAKVRAISDPQNMDGLTLCVNPAQVTVFVRNAIMVTLSARPVRDRSIIRCQELGQKYGKYGQFRKGKVQNLWRYR